MRSVVERLPLRIRDRLCGDRLFEVDELRLRVNRPVELRWGKECTFMGEPVSADELNEAVRMLADHSLYACEERFKQGFFSMPGGYRVGLTGEYSVQGERVELTHVGAISIRVAREIPGAADIVMPLIHSGGRVCSTLILSAPMLGKTTMLRDIARQLSQRGVHVAVSDERSELAGCREGVPQLDVGDLTDVCDALPKRFAIPALVRSMSPQVIITDELGHEGDAMAAADAARSGVALIASAHADSYRRARGRRALAPLFEDGLFQRVLLLSGAPGQLSEVFNERGERL